MFEFYLVTQFIRGKKRKAGCKKTRVDEKCRWRKCKTGDCGKVEKIEEGKGKGGDGKRLDFGKGRDIGKVLFREKIGDTGEAKDR
jgi:hypothetical protein